MKAFITFTLILTFVSCTKQSPPTTDKKTYAYDGNGVKLGLVLNQTADYIEIKTSTGYIERTTPEGLPYAYTGQITFANDWFYYRINRDLKSYYLPNKGVGFEKRTIALATGDNVSTQTHRYCQTATPTTILSGEGSLQRAETQRSDGFWKIENISAGESVTGIYPKYYNGLNKEDLEAYELVACSNADIGYPQLGTTGASQFMVSAPVTTRVG